MPNFSQLAHQLRTDVAGLDWPDPQSIRAAGDRRRPIQLILTASAALVITVTVLVLVVPDRAPERGSAPVAGIETTVSPSASAAPALSPPAESASPAPQHTRSTTAIPPAALLTAADFGPTFRSEGAPYPVASVPNPFLGCGSDGLPGNRPLVASLGNALGEGVNGMGAIVLNSVLRFDTAGAHQTMTAIDATLSGACTGRFQVVSRSLGGDESLLLRSTDLSVVLAQSAHGTILYYAIVRQGDYLIWITVIDEFVRTDQTSLVTTAVHKAETRLCATITC